MIKYLVAASGLFLSPMVMADPNVYGGAGFLYSIAGDEEVGVEYDYDNVNPALFLGIQPDHSTDSLGSVGNFALEIQYMIIGGDSEYSSADSSVVADTDGDSFGISGVYHFDNGLFAKLGWHRWEVEEELADVSTNDVGTDVLLGLGYQTELNPDVAVRFEYQGLRISDTNMHNFGASLVFGF